MSDKSYREFWLDRLNVENDDMLFNDNICEVFVSKINPLKTKDIDSVWVFEKPLHVIEYQALLDEQAAHKATQEKVKKLREALKFYADVTEYRGFKNTIQLDAGQNARQALEESE